MTKPTLSDERGFLVGTLIKVALVLGLIALSAIEAGAILFARFEIQDVADRAAVAAADAFDRSGSYTEARQAAIDSVRGQDRDARVKEFEALPNGTIEVTVVKTAGTLVVHRIGLFGIDDFAKVRATGEGSPPEF